MEIAITSGVAHPGIQLNLFTVTTGSLGLVLLDKADIMGITRRTLRVIWFSFIFSHIHFCHLSGMCRLFLDVRHGVRCWSHSGTWSLPPWNCTQGEEFGDVNWSPATQGLVGQTKELTTDAKSSRKSLKSFQEWVMWSLQLLCKMDWKEAWVEAESYSRDVTER